MAAERDEAGRKEYQLKQVGLTSEQLVVIDESGSNLALSLLYGWGIRSERVYGKVPRNWGPNLTLLAALKVEGILIESVVYFEGATTQAIFEDWIGRKLLPELKPGQTVIMDNLASHTGRRVREMIEGVGCKLEYLPAYSPDFSPIELVFSKAKAFLRRLGARNQAALVAGWEQALEAITPQEAQNFFRHCGYKVPLPQAGAQ